MLKKAAAPKNTYKKAIEAVQRKNDLTERAAALQIELTDASAEVSPLQNQAYDLDRQMRRHERGGPDEDESRLNACIAEGKRLTRAIETAQNKAQAIERALEDVRAELAALDQPLGIEPVLALQNAIEEAEAGLARIDEHIADQQGLISAAAPGEDPVAPLVAKKEALLAEAALGAKNADERKRLDDELAIASKQYSKDRAERDKVVKEAEHVIAGLQRMRAGTEADLTRLQGLHPSLLDGFLMGEAETTAAEYVELADALVAKYARLLALSAMVDLVGKRRRSALLTPASHQLLLPAFELKACAEARHKNHPGIIFRASPPTSDLKAVEAEERARLKGLGVRL